MPSDQSTGGVRREGDLQGLEEVEAQGGYSDTVVEMFGQPMQVKHDIPET